MSPVPEAADQAAPRRRRRRRWLLGLGVGFLGLLGAVEAFGRSDWLSDAVAREVAPVARDLLGLDAVVGRVEVHLTRGEVRLEGLALTHHAPDNAELHGAPVLSVEAAEVALGFRGFRPTLGRVEIWRPSIHLHVGPDGVLELAGVKIEPQGDFDRLPWEEFKLHDARVQVEHEKWQVALSGLSAAPAGFETFDLSFDALEVDVRDWSQTATDVSIPGVRLSPGLVRIPDLDLATEHIRIHGDASIEEGVLDGDLILDVDLDGLAPLTRPGVILSGRASTALALGGTTKTPDITGHLDVHDLLVDRLRPDGVRVDLWFGDLDADLRLTNGLLTASPVEAAWSGGTVILHAGVDLAHLGVSLSGQVRGVQLVDPARGGLLSKAFDIARRSGGPVVVQRYLPEARDGEKRLVWAGGRLLGGYLRKRAPGDFRHNLKQGGRPHACEITREDEAVARAISPHLLRHGIGFAGLDVIGGKLVEVNTLNPGGVHWADALGTRPRGEIAREALQRLLATLTQQKQRNDR